MKIKATSSKQREAERCAVCRDGPEGLVVCRGCGTLLHASCLIDMRGCPTVGCDEKDPLQEEPRKEKLPPLSVHQRKILASFVRMGVCPVHNPSARANLEFAAAFKFDLDTLARFCVCSVIDGTAKAKCAIHDPNVSQEALQDLYDLWGTDIDKACTCSKPKFPNGIKPGPYGVEHKAFRPAAPPGPPPKNLARPCPPPPPNRSRARESIDALQQHLEDAKIDGAIRKSRKRRSERWQLALMIGAIIFGIISAAMKGCG